MKRVLLGWFVIAALVGALGATAEAQGNDCVLTTRQEVNKTRPTINLCVGVASTPHEAKSGTHKPPSFTSCKAGIDWITTKQNVGWAQPGSVVITATARTVGDKLEISLRPSRVSGRYSVVESSVSWPDMTSEQRSAVAKALPLVAEHERGHLALANYVATQVTPKSVSVPRRSGVDDQVIIDQVVDEITKEVLAVVEEAEDVYEARSANGITQSRVGGTSVPSLPPCGSKDSKSAGLTCGGADEVSATPGPEGSSATSIWSGSLLAVDGPGVDVALVIDNTSSMEDDIAAVLAASSDIAACVLADGNEGRIAIVTYNDPGTAVVLAFSNDPAAVRSALAGIRVSGGGDEPEHVYSGIATASRLDWRTGVQKEIILFGDAPPKDPEPGTGLTAVDAALLAVDLDPARISAVAISQSVESYFGVKDRADIGMTGEELAEIEASLSAGAVDGLREVVELTGGELVTATDADGASEALLTVLETVIEEDQGLSWGEYAITALLVAAAMVVAVALWYRRQENSTRES